MRLYRQILTENDCYRSGRRIVPKGIMVHSTGANNPKLSRYVAPDDGRLGKPSSRHWNQSGVSACVHAFIGKLPDGSVATYQTLPWTARGWHCGGKGNNTHISFEICEDGLNDPVYFAKVYREAVELTAYLCKKFGFDPLADGVVICHAEGHRRGIASNHADVLHWFCRHGKDMDDFRRDVDRLLHPAEPEGEQDEEKEEEEIVSYEEWVAYMERYRRELAKKDCTMETLFEDAKAMGMTDGSRPRDFATREECAVMVRKAALYPNKT